MIGHSFDHFCKTEDMSSIRMMFVGSVRLADQDVDIIFGQTKYFSQFTDDGPAFECVVCCQESSMIPSISFEYIIGHVISFIPAEVDVKIWRCGAVRIDEAFEVKIQFKRIHISDIKTKSDD